MSLKGAVRRLLGRDDVPAGLASRFAADEHVLASAALTGGGQLVATSRGLWLPEPDEEWRRVGWHLISKATWGNGAIALVEAREVEVVGGAVLIADLPVRRLRLAQPGKVPEIVHQRVTASIKTRHHRDLPGGGAWFVQRKVAGRDGIVLQVRPDPGTDEAATRQVAGDVARASGLGG
jgi:hypothetical protein